MIQRIDSHQHFWQLARGDYGWLRPGEAELAPLLRDFLPEHLQAALRANAVVRTVLVQAAATEAETEFLLELARQHAFIGGVVGWVDLSRASSSATLEQWARQPKFKGVRPMLQDLPADDWIAAAPHPDVVRTMVQRGLRFDALVRPRHLQALLRFIDAYPDLPVVVDHAAKPELAAGWSAPWVGVWRTQMAQIAARRQVVCKLSGLLTEAGAPAARSTAAGIEAVRPVWDDLLRWFGAERIMWGSDWPVVTLAAGYADWVALSAALVGELSAGEQARIWRGCAGRFYGIDLG